jgi:hypothetical protein
MRRTIVLVLPLVFMLFYAPTVFSGPNMREGKWEITTTTEMPGLPVAMPGVTYTHCLTNKDMVPQKQEKNQDCKITDTKISGNTVTWVMKCSGKDGPMESVGKITYSGDTFEGSFTTTINDPSQGKMTITNHMKGRRIGDCTK